MLNRQLVLTASTITVDGTSVGSTYNIPLGNPTVDQNELIDFFTISGTPTLTSSLTITSSGTPAGKVKYTFLSRASVVLGSNTLTIFGYSISAVQALSGFQLVAFWDGTAWGTTFSQVEIPSTGVPNSRLAVMPQYTVKMNSGGGAYIPQDVGLDEFSALINTQYDHIYFIANFNSGAISPGSYRQDILIPYAGEFTKIFGYVMQQLGGVDDATVQFGIATSAGGGSASFYDMTLAANLSANNVVTVTSGSFSGPATFNANNYLSVESTKSTWGGQVMFTVVTKRDTP